jgi:hypothetical protein
MGWLRSNCYIIAFRPRVKKIIVGLYIARPLTLPKVGISSMVTFFVLISYKDVFLHRKLFISLVYKDQVFEKDIPL